MPAVDDLSGGVDADQVGDADAIEGDSEGVHPETVVVFRVAYGDVAGDALPESVLAEQPEGGRQALLAVAAGVVGVVEDRLARDGQACRGVREVRRARLGGRGHAHGRLTSLLLVCADWSVLLGGPC
ncbi:hypothetical protein GCM10027612_57720 [Microbispora bryophytorum subsp. camponoti]